MRAPLASDGWGLRTFFPRRRRWPETSSAPSRAGGKTYVGQNAWWQPPQRTLRARPSPPPSLMSSSSAPTSYPPMDSIVSLSQPPSAQTPRRRLAAPGLSSPPIAAGEVHSWIWMWDWQNVAEQCRQTKGRKSTSAQAEHLLPTLRSDMTSCTLGYASVAVNLVDTTDKKGKRGMAG